MLSDRLLRGRKTDTFTLQWHLTNACDAHCTHCYDRSNLAALSTAACLAILRDFQVFCHTHRVQGQISLSGGNPLLHPGFWEIYAAIKEAGLRVSILGNPLDEATLQRLIAIRRPGYYQVSLEGLRDLNDGIRGAGHFDRTLEFLHLAKRVNLTTHVMLTLQQANIDQVLPLGAQLASLTRKFTFNRLSQVGEACGMAVPGKEEYARFLEAYLEAAATEPVLGIKDNLFNILRHCRRAPLFQGCTGYGCGAAFNFVAVLPDGEVHACRKFPSPLGRLTEKSLSDIYHAPMARQYRRGPRGCAKCPLHRHCRGCMAVTYGQGGDPLSDRDPLCFL